MPGRWSLRQIATEVRLDDLVRTPLKDQSLSVPVCCRQTRNRPVAGLWAPHVAKPGAWCVAGAPWAVTPSPRLHPGFPDFRGAKRRHPQVTLVTKSSIPVLKIEPETNG